MLVAPILKNNTYTKNVYLPEGNWLNLLTGEEISVSAGGKTVTVSADLGQIPVFMDMDCSEADKELLADVFGGTNWKKISGAEICIETIEP